MEYEDVSKQAGELWQSNGAKAAVQFIASTVANETGELRGRLLGLLGDYQVEGGNFEGASGSYVDALELFVTPEYRFTVLACAMGACVHTRRFKQGMRYAVEADGIRSNHSVSNRWLGVYHMNSGRLAMLATDYSASVEDFTASARYFRADGKCEQEALNAEVYLAEVLMNIGKLEESLSLCRKVRVKVTSDVVKFNLDVLQGRIASRIGDMANAERFASRCVETIFAKLGKQMAYGFVNVMVLTKELVERGSPVLASDILRLYIEKMSSLGGVDVAEILRGMDQ